MSKKSDKLDMTFGKACHILRQEILFQLLKDANKNICYRCGQCIKSRKTLSIDHKIPWLNSENPKKLFFDLTNTTFSHRSCNSMASGKNSQCQAVIGATGFRGVSYAKWAKSYFARINFNGKRLKFYFRTAKAAAEKYDKEIINIYGDDAITNKSLGFL